MGKPHTSRQDEKKKKMIDRYNNPSYVGIYDRRYLHLQFEKFRKLQTEFPPAWTFSQQLGLDFGGGTGLLMDWFFKNAKDVNPLDHHLITLDLSIEMLKKAFEKYSIYFQSLRTSNITNLICADGEHLPLRSGIFDYTVTLTALQNLPHLDKGLSEIKRIQAPSSIFAFSFLKKSIQFHELESQIASIWNNQNSFDIKMLGKNIDIEDYLGIVSSIIPIKLEE